jgi:Probable RNA ligase (RNA_lig_DRB0094).
MKMGGIYSQGLALPIQVVNLFVDQGGLKLPVAEPEIGKDVTEVLGVRKYLTPEELEELRVPPPPRRYEWVPGWLWSLTRRFRRPVKKAWPSGIYKTDEDRLQAMPQILEAMSGEMLYATEKLDGCSATYFIRRKDRSWWGWLLRRPDYDFGVCSRNLRIFSGQKEKHHHGAYWDMAKKYDLEGKLVKFWKQYHTDIAIQGEIVGPGIQGNKYGLAERQLFVYQIQSKGQYAEYSVLKS